MHIAERFRLAYVSRERRLDRAAARLRRQAERREMERSGGQAAIRQWELEV